MGFFGRSVQQSKSAATGETNSQEGRGKLEASPGESNNDPPTPQDVPLPTPKSTFPVTEPTIPISQGNITGLETQPHKAARLRRFSFKTFSYTYVDEPKHELSAIKEHDKKQRAAEALTKQLSTPLTTSSDRKAKESALVVRSLIIGPASSTASPQLTKTVAKPQLSKIKSQLMQPKSANKVIAQLRNLPLLDDPTYKAGSKATGEESAKGPIHAVCLSHTDAEEDELHFSRLAAGTDDSQSNAQSVSIRSVATAPIDMLAQLFNDMHLIDLVKAPDLGLGQPGDGDGILAGAVPTAETVINGIEQITPQLMALGFATGRAVLPDHKGVYPPLDRMSVLTYWWGLEVALPPPSMAYLGNVHSISNAVMNFLSAVALINNGLREILPFVRYISQFMDFEFNAMKAQDKGKGVVCAATWIMPAAMVPRPWDFPTPPKDPSSPEARKDDNPPTPTQKVPPVAVPIPLPDVIITSATESAESVPPLTSS